MQELPINSPRHQEKIIRAYKCIHYDYCLDRAVAEKGGKHGAGYLDCTGCEKREDREIDNHYEWWKWLLLYAAIHHPRAYKEYTWSDEYRENRESILATANRRYRERSRRA